MIKYGKNKDGSYVHNCIINRRENEKAPRLFSKNIEDEGIVTQLNGYAIIPIEEYFELTGNIYDEILENIDLANKELWENTDG